MKSFSRTTAGLVLAFAVIVGLGATRQIINRLNDIPGVRIGPLTDGQVLAYDETTGTWTNSASGAGDMLMSVYDADEDGVVDTGKFDATGLLDEAAASLLYQASNSVLTRVVGIGAGASGDVIYRDATGWTNLVKGTDGQVLKLASGLPAWGADIEGSGDDLGDHTATEDLDLAGNVITNVGAVWIGDTNVAGMLGGLAENKQPTNSVLSLVSANTTPGTILTVNALGEATLIGPGTDGYVLTSKGSEMAPTFDPPIAADNLGNHTATQALDMADFDIENVGNLTADEFNVTTLNVTGLIDGAKLTNTVYVAASVVQVDDDAYASGWNGSTNVPTKNAVYDKIELLSPKADPTFTGTATAPTAAIATLTLGSGTVTNNIGAVMAAPAANAVVDMNFASRIVTLDGALTFTHVTNAVANREMTHTLYLRAGGSDRALTIPSTWQTNAFSPKPANITNGWLTKIYVTTIGATGDSASQTNAMVSFEYYKVP